MSDQVMLEKIQRRLESAKYGQKQLDKEYRKSEISTRDFTKQTYLYVAIIHELKYLLDWYERKGEQYGKNKRAITKADKRSRSRK